MRLVKSGHVVDDTYVRVPDDAPIPDGVPVIVPAARFLADAEEILRREAPTGVLWPNNRRIAELGTVLGPAVPYGEIADVVEDIAAAYLELRERPEEQFIHTVARLGVEPFKERVYATR